MLERTWEYLQRGDVLVRLALLRADGRWLLWLITGGWAPPLSLSHRLHAAARTSWPG